MKPNKRIFLEWNGEVFWDSTIPIKIDRIVPLSDADGLFLISGADKYRLMFPISKRSKMKMRHAKYIYEVNSQTKLNHEYRCLAGCRLYRKRKLIASGITFIEFNRTVDEKPEYEDFVCSNWNFNPIWGYSSEVVNVLYR